VVAGRVPTGCGTDGTVSTATAGETSAGARGCGVSGIGGGCGGCGGGCCCCGSVHSSIGCGRGGCGCVGGNGMKSGSALLVPGPGCGQLTPSTLSA
jgi:hypothetical protein